MFVYLTAAQVEFDGEEGDGESDPGTPHHNNTPGALTALSGGSVVSSAVQAQRHLTPPHRMTPGEATASTGSQLVIAITAEDTKTSSRGNVFILKELLCPFGLDPIPFCFSSVSCFHHFPLYLFSL